MAEKKNKSDFNAMNVAELKRYYFAGTWSFSKRTFENFARGNRSRSRKNGCASDDPNFEKDQTTDADE